jgi:6-phosphogluconate dehydrogenase
MKRALGMHDKEIGDVLAKWNTGVLDSFLIEITRDIMYFNDDDGTPLLEKIMDSAGQKGTGKWTAINALDLGMPVTLIAEAVLSRCLSSIKDERTRASKVLQYVGRSSKFEGNKEQFLEDLEQALYASKIISYAQGFMLMQEVCHILLIADEQPTDLSIGCQGVWMEAQQAIYRSYVAWRMYHPLCFLEGYHRCLP